VTDRKAIVLVTDDRIFPAAVFAAQRLAALSDRDDTDVFIFTDAADELRAAPSRGYPFRVVPIVWPAGQSFPVALFRLVIPLQMVSRYSRVLYLDVDTYVEDSRLFALLDIDMGGYSIAAARDLVICFGSDEVELNAVLSNPRHAYFNSGVLLIDCHRYVAEGTVEKIWQRHERAIHLRYLDQSVLNRHFDGAFLELSPAFNMFVSALSSELPRVCPPVVTHFAGRDKPWFGPGFPYAHRARAEMERYFPDSPWPDFMRRHAKPRGGGRQPDASAASMGWSFATVPAVATYVRTTRFADVVARITTLHLDALPAVGASA
jgi:hypothetical protein